MAFCLKILITPVLFCETTDTPELDSGGICLGFQSQAESSCLHALPVHNGFLLFTSGVTPADPLAVNFHVCFS